MKTSWQTVSQLKKYGRSYREENSDSKAPISERKEMVLMTSNYFRTLYECEEVQKAFITKGYS